VSWPDRPVVVRAPATSANLGPGFDSLGLALNRHDVVAARIIGAGLEIEVSGTGEETAAAGEDHLVIRAMRAAFAALGGQPPGIALQCRNAIPQGYGLGSSAAAIVAGLLAARALAGAAARTSAGAEGRTRAGAEARAGAGGRAAAAMPPPGLPGDLRRELAARAGARAAAAMPPPGLPGDLRRELAAGAGARAAAAMPPDAELLRLAAGLEGHPDNVAACLAGGLTIAWTAADGVRSARLSPMAGIEPVVCVPPEALATAEARLALPPAVPHADAVQNGARAALLIAAFTSDPGLLLDATEDFLHQRYRAAAMPRTASLVASLRSAGIAAVVSGAGPAVLALTVTGRQPAAAEVASIAAAEGAGWQVSPLSVAAQGAHVEP
jgi:homoserine kinase